MSSAGSGHIMAEGGQSRLMSGFSMMLGTSSSMNGTPKLLAYTAKPARLMATGAANDAAWDRGEAAAMVLLAVVAGANSIGASISRADDDSFAFNFASHLRW